MQATWFPRSAGHVEQPVQLCDSLLVVMPNVSVVIPTHGRVQHLRTCLARLETPPGWNVTTFVVENGTSEAREVAEYYHARYLYLNETGAARARNAGVEAAGEVEAVALLDDDVTPCPGWLEAIVRPILARDAEATVGGVRVVTDARIPRSYLGFYVDTSVAMDPERPFLAGLNMAVQPAAFRAVGGFRTELGPGALGVGGEDVLLGLMMKAAGYRIKAVLDAEVDHHVPSARFTKEALLARAFGGGRADGWIHYHWLKSEYPWMRIRIARSFVLTRLPGISFTRRLALVERYGREWQMLAESGKPRLADRTEVTALGSVVKGESGSAAASPSP